MTVCSSAQRKKRKVGNKLKLQGLGNHDEFINRITKTLYYGKIPLGTDRFSLPVSELASELFSDVKKGCSLERLHVDEAAEISRNACVSPCSLVLALLYLERLKTCNSEYVERVAPSELFLVSMMVASKFLHDDGEEDEVFNDEWATSGGLELKEMNRLEREFLNAINWEVYVSEQTFWTRLQRMETTLALREGKRRGWFSYTELCQLVHTAELVSLAHTLITVSAVCLTSYTASVLAMVGSTIMVNQMPPVTSSLVSSLTSSSPALIPLPSTLPLPLATPDNCMTNHTLPEEMIAHWSLKFWEDDDTTNHSFSEENDDTSVNQNVARSGIKSEWLEQKDWLEMITHLTTTTNPSTLMPVDILLY